MSAGPALEAAHKAGGKALGRLAMMITLQRISSQGVREVIEGLTKALEELRRIPLK